MAIELTPLTELANRMKLLSSAVAWIEAFDTQLKRDIINFVQDDQLRKQGIDADGDVIGYYSYFTSQLNPKKKFNTHYTLEDTGKFFKSMYIVVLNDSFVIEADGNKGDDNLFEKYGEEIIGLTDENIEKVAEKIKVRYENYIRKVLFGT